MQQLIDPCPVGLSHSPGRSFSITDCHRFGAQAAVLHHPIDWNGVNFRLQFRERSVKIIEVEAAGDARL